MICEKCNQRPAKVHMTKIINGEKVEQYLCEACAKGSQSNGYQMDLDFSNMLSNLFDIGFNNIPQNMVGGKGTPIKKETICPQCSMTLSEFRKKGKFGCAHCYESFKDSVEILSKKLHGNGLHSGKVPQRAGAELKVKRRLLDLRKQLNKAIDKEEYELAAKLRDEIRQIEGGNPL